MSTRRSILFVLGLAWTVWLASCDGAVKYGSNVVKWKADDQVLVVNNGGVFKPDYVAIYPRTNSEGVENVIDGNEATFFLPAIQTYYDNAIAENFMPKVAYSIGEEFEFKYVLGGLCLPLGGEGYQVTKVVLTSANVDEALWGTCTTTVSTTGEDPTSMITNDEEGKNTITLDCGEGVMLNDTILTFFGFAVPVGSLERGFSVEVYNGDQRILEKSTSTPPGDNFIQRRIIRRMNNTLFL